jgi:predicted MFS family arabinose efflux permease
MSDTATSPPAPPTDGYGDPSGRVARSGLLLVLLCAVQFLDGMDVSAMGTALPRIQRDLAMSPSALQWVVSAYVLGYGGFLLLGGRTADLLARRRLLVGSLLTFAAASCVGGLAGGGSVLVAARLVLGMSAAFSAPTALAILLDTYRDESGRNRALGAFAATGAAGFVLGLALGGALAGISWRLTLLVPGGVALAVATGARRVMPAGGARPQGRDRLDVPGALTVTSGVLLLVFGVTHAAAAGWADWATVVSLAAAVVLITGFVQVERTSRAPLIPLDTFRRPQLAYANACALLFQGTYVAFQFVATLYYQDELGWSPFQAGLAFLLGGVIVVLASPRFATAVGRTGPWPLVATGLALQAVSYLWFVLWFDSVGGVVLVLVQQTLGGLGWAATYTALNIAAVSKARDHEQGLVSAMFIAAIQIGSGVVLAVVATVFAASGEAGFGAYRAGGWTVVTVSVVTTVLAGLGVVRYRRAASAP